MSYSRFHIGIESHFKHEFTFSPKFTSNTFYATQLRQNNFSGKLKLNCKFKMYKNPRQTIRNESMKPVNWWMAQWCKNYKIHGQLSFTLFWIENDKNTQKCQKSKIPCDFIWFDLITSWSWVYSHCHLYCRGTVSWTLWNTFGWFLVLVLV